MPNFIRNIKRTQREITQAFLNKINKMFRAKQQVIERDLKNELRGYLKASPTYDALINGPLNAHFGFPKGTERIYADALIEKIVNTVNVKIKNFVQAGNTVQGGVDIVAVPMSYQDIVDDLDIPVVTRKGQELDWARWLLLEGSAPIVTGYRITFKGGPLPDRAFENNSRSGEALMIPQGIWVVPAKYAGTAQDNWITRSIRDSKPRLAKIIRDHFKLRKK